MTLLIAAALLGATAAPQAMTPPAGTMTGQDAPPPPGARGPGRMLAQLDTDRDGRISRVEFAKQGADRFARLDSNGNGTIEASEMAAAPGGGRGMMRRDGNADGTLTRAEADKQSADRFLRFDTNGDGFIDTAEQAAIGGGMRRGGARGGGRTPPPAPAPAPAPAGI